MSKIIGGIAVGLALLTTLVLGIMSSTIVRQGEVGVVFHLNDGVQETTLSRGHHFISPLASVTRFPVSTETVDVTTFDVLTRDGKPLELNMSYDFAVDAEMVSDVFEKFRGQSIDAITDSWLEDRAMRAALTVFSRYSVLDVFQNLPRIQGDIFTEMRDIVDSYGFNIQAVTIQAPRMDEATSNAIQEVVNAQQELERMEIERQQAEVMANTRIEEARGRAESTRIEAEAQAEANDLLQESLTRELIDMEIARNWNGELPAVSGSNSIVSLPGEVFGSE